jgi:hypothetical protein
MGLEYVWSMTSRPDGSDAVLVGSGSAWPRFVADKTGNYVVSLYVSANGVVSGVSTVVIAARGGSANLEVDLYLYGGAGHGTFLGCLTCSEEVLMSVCNLTGKYGSPQSQMSIWNDLGRFGDVASASSPWSHFYDSGPVIVGADGMFYGYMTVNGGQQQQTQIEWVLNVLRHFEAGGIEMARQAACEK